jgi:SAM-dependent methyltransferase
MTREPFGPDPGRGVEASEAYAESYAEGHRVPVTLDYKRGYICSLVIDALLRDYLLLEVGCGVGGYFRLLSNHKKIVGLDFSKSMIEKARELAPQIGLERVEFVQGKFEDYQPAGLFDAVNLVGVIGWYVPWIGNEHLLEKTRAMLRPGGLAVFSFVKPRTLFHRLKAALFPGRTVVISEARFSRLTARSGLQTLLSIDAGPNVYVFCRTPGPASS